MRGPCFLQGWRGCVKSFFYKYSSKVSNNSTQLIPIPFADEFTESHLISQELLADEKVAEGPDITHILRCY